MQQNQVADLDTASNSCPPSQMCNFKAHHMEFVKTVVCKREEMPSRSTKDSATLFIAGGRHKNCVQSLKDSSKEIQVLLAQRWRGAFNSSPRSWLPLLVLCLHVERHRRPVQSELPKGAGMGDTDTVWGPCSPELPWEADGTPRVLQAVQAAYGEGSRTETSTSESIHSCKECNTLCILFKAPESLHVYGSCQLSPFVPFVDWRLNLHCSKVCNSTQTSPSHHSATQLSALQDQLYQREPEGMMFLTVQMRILSLIFKMSEALFVPKSTN